MHYVDVYISMQRSFISTMREMNLDNILLNRHLREILLEQRK